jgi:hypothetical protein
MGRWENNTSHIKLGNTFVHPSMGVQGRSQQGAGWGHGPPHGGNFCENPLTNMLILHVISPKFSYMAPSKKFCM